MPYRYPPEFRRKVLDLLAAGRSVASLSVDLGVSDQTIYNWRRQDAVDRGLEPGLASSEKEELRSARRRIVELETELAVTRRANELLKAQVVSPKRRYEAIQIMRDEGLPTQVACRVLGVSESGFYEWRVRPPSARAIRHVWLTDLIHQIHQQSRGTYGAPRVHAELRLGYVIRVGHNAVAMLMRRAGLQGLSGNRGPKRQRIRPVDTPADLVDRNFARHQPNQLWVTDVTEHPTREGKIYCAVVLDTFSRRVVGWSIDRSATAGLVTSALGMALGMAISNRQPGTETVIHPDQGTPSPPGRSPTGPANPGSSPQRGSVGDCFDCEDNGGVVGSGLTLGPPAMAHPNRVGQRYLRIPRDLPQPATTPHRSRDANPDRIRENPLRQPDRRTPDPSELTPENPVTIKRHFDAAPDRAESGDQRGTERYPSDTMERRSGATRVRMPRGC